MRFEISKDIQLAQTLLAEGKLVAIPTETVYGLAANALNADAVVKIFEVKNRPSFDPLIVHVSSPEKAELLTTHVTKNARKLMEVFWPGPLTIVLHKKSIIPDIVTSGLPTVGLRMPDHALTLELLGNLEFPLAAPSANPFGYISPTTPQHVAEQLGDHVPLILDGGFCSVGVESTIIDCTSDIPVILRLGGTSVEAITEAIGEVIVNTSSSSSPSAPGMLLTHYSPRKPMELGNLTDLLHKHAGKKISVLSFREYYLSHENEVLSETGDLHEAARNLFSAMRILDQTDCDIILAEPAPNVGLGRAINDRLTRASAR